MELNEKQKQAVEDLKRASKNYIEQIPDGQLGIFTEVAEALGFKAYPGQSMLGNEDICHFINDKDQLLDVIYNETPDDETLESIRGE